VLTQRGDLRGGEIVVRGALHLEERTVEQVRILEGELGEPWVAVRPAADRDLGKFLEAVQEVEVRSRVVVPPTALALNASAFVAQPAEGEAFSGIRESVVHGCVSLARVPHDRDLRDSGPERYCQREEQDGRGGPTPAKDHGRVRPYRKRP